jgi:hypothetical protein
MQQDVPDAGSVIDASYGRVVGAFGELSGSSAKMAAMTSVDPADPERRALFAFLEAQRSSVLAIVDGLDERAWRTPVVPSGWTPLGLVGHLGFAERHWFQEVATGTAVPVPWPAEESTQPPDEDGGEGEDGGENAPYTTDLPVAEVLDFYRDQCRRANEMLASTPLDSPPRGTLHGEVAEEVSDLRWIVLHMIEETARHAGHLDIARELIDGRTGLGPR